MVRLFQIAAYSCLLILLTGCDGPDRTDPLVAGIKISDLAPVNVPRPAFQTKIDFNVFTFEIPADKINAFQEIRYQLYRKPLRYTSHDAFEANSFFVGFGQVEMWDKIGSRLRNLGARRAKTASLLFADGQTSDIYVAELRDQEKLYYISTEGSTETATIGPGKVVLRTTAERIPGERGLCRINAIPTFITIAPPAIPLLPLGPGKVINEYHFVAAEFRLKMGQADFILLGPKKYIDHRKTLAGLFFSGPGHKPVFRVFLIVCARISD